MVLHNLCAKYRDHLDNEWSADMQEQLTTDPPLSTCVGTRCTQAEDTRNAIKKKLASEKDTMHASCNATELVKQLWNMGIIISLQWVWDSWRLN